MRALPLLSLLALAACATDTRPTMNPGVDCVRCHTQAKDVALPSAPNAPGLRATSLVFSAAGTVFKRPDSPVTDGVENVTLRIRNALIPDAGVELTSNTAGNFYTAEPLYPALGLSVELEYQGRTVAMATHPTPSLLYGDATPLVGVGCNGCHGVPAGPTPPPDAGPLPTCPLPDAGMPDPTLDQPCGGDLGCCSGYCVGGVCTGAAGDAGATCTSSTACYSGICLDGRCSDDPGENGHRCTSGIDCRLGYCERGICTGAPGRISIPDGLTMLPDGGFVYPNP
jgi:hypothetical protein